MAIKPQFIACLLKVKQRPNRNENNKQMHQISTQRIRVVFFFSSVLFPVSNVKRKMKFERGKKIILKLIMIEKQKYVHHRPKQAIISDQRHILAEILKIKLVTKQFAVNATNR